MPTYDYRCESCKDVIEQNVPIVNRDEPAPCEKCGGWLRRIVSFKGLTWAPTAGGMR